MKSTNEILGYRVLHLASDSFVCTDERGNNYMDSEEPLPIARGDAYRRLAGILDQRPDLDHADFSVEPVYRELSPLETASKELGARLRSLCALHGLDLGLTPDQIDAQIARELTQFGARAR